MTQNGLKASKYTKTYQIGFSPINCTWKTPFSSSKIKFEKSICYLLDQMAFNPALLISRKTRVKKSRVMNQIKTNHLPTLFQTLSSIGNEKNTTIIFPVPIDILGHFMKGQKVTKGESRGSRKSRSRPSGLDLHTPTARPGTDQTLLQGDSPRSYS